MPTIAPRTPPITGPPIRLAVCVSGSGTTLQNLIDAIKARRLHAQIVQVVASRPRIGAIPRAEAAGIPLALANRKAHSIKELSTSVFEPIRHSASDLVILGGFLSLLNIPLDYKNRVINMHPALIPAFSGEGFFGTKVHQAALDAGVKVSGCTAHFANDSYDSGPIIAQRAVPVLEDDTPELLAARIFKEECSLLPEVITLYAQGRIHVVGRRTVITRPH
jgi:phosphoribosylglycinamide formyltransferase-1